MTKSTPRPATFDINDPVFQAILAQAVAAQLAAATPAKPKAGKSKPTSAPSSKAAENDKACIAAFKKAGFGDVTPRKDVFSFRLWFEKGFRPMEGSKSQNVNGMRLFHSSQVRPITPEDIAARADQIAAAAARNAGSKPKLVK